MQPSGATNIIFVIVNSKVRIVLGKFKCLFISYLPARPCSISNVVTVPSWVGKFYSIEMAVPISVKLVHLASICSKVQAMIHVIITLRSK